MDFNAIVNQLQNAAPQIASSYCIVNGNIMLLDDVQRMGYTKFSLRSKLNMPLKLYKYFSNTLVDLKDSETQKPIIDEVTGKVKQVNYSLQALRNNTVFMQSPSLFDDVYDSDISLNYDEYEKLRLIEYCDRCQINVSKNMPVQEIGDAFIKAIASSFNATHTFDYIFSKTPTSEREEFSNKYFITRLKQAMFNSSDLGKAVTNIIYSDFRELSQVLQNTFRTTCFSTTPYSQLMWGGAYANCHKGFCVEYTVLPNDPKYQNIFLNLFPMIYCKTRPNMTERLAKFRESTLSDDVLWDIYFHGALRKSIDWAFQDEWRLLLPMQNSGSETNYNIPFFPITKVFLGNRMPQSARKEIIEICHSRNIPYVGVTRNPNVFEMQDCLEKCENCPNYLYEVDY